MLGSANYRYLPICTASSSSAGVSVGKKINWRAQLEWEMEDIHTVTEVRKGMGGFRYHKLFR